MESEVLYPIHPIWKVSHGQGDISKKQSNWLDENYYLTVHKSTKKSQGENFLKQLTIGSVVNLSRSGDVASLVKVVSDCFEQEDSPFDEGWVFRKYEVIQKLPNLKPYTYELMRGWTPNYNGTIFQVPTKQYGEFEQHILKPFYGMTLKDLNTILSEQTTDTQTNHSSQGSINMNTSPLNQILYGPPGTGKTYHTIEAAVKAADPEYYHSLKLPANEQVSEAQRAELKKAYDGLVKAERIRFVTFHQSYGYEEFVEGLSASTTDNDKVKYTVKDGVFKDIADEARKNLENIQKEQEELDQEQKFDLALEAFKLSALASSDEFPLTDAVSIIAIEETGFRYGGKGGNWKDPRLMKFADLKCFYLNNVQNEAEVLELGESVSGLAKQHKNYFLRAYEEIISKKFVKQNYVLVIDEINRGNISKIFGELITLIEPSKRMSFDKKGEDESLKIKLPHSEPLFSVPDNLYLIGTMNTADRSLAMMDTALRRRFDFVEMMPKPELLNGVVVNGIDLERLLKVINERIEILYDREHTLGHAFFMPVKNKLEDKEQKHLAFSELVSVFQNKIIPLLEEYFFEDWDKIRLVLADNQKPDDLQFVTKKSMNQSSLKALFGDKHTLDQFGEDYQQYSLKEKDNQVWKNADAYIGIYNPESVKATQTSDVQTDSTGSESSEVNDKK